jgi:hypothetical protein
MVRIEERRHAYPDSGASPTTPTGATGISCETSLDAAPAFVQRTHRQQVAGGRTSKDGATEACGMGGGGQQGDSARSMAHPTRFRSRAGRTTNSCRPLPPGSTRGSRLLAFGSSPVGHIESLRPRPATCTHAQHVSGPSARAPIANYDRLCGALGAETARRVQAGDAGTEARRNFDGGQRVHRDRHAGEDAHRTPPRSPARTPRGMDGRPREVADGRNKRQDPEESPPLLRFSVWGSRACPGRSALSKVPTRCARESLLVGHNYCFALLLFIPTEHESSYHGTT